MVRKVREIGHERTAGVLRSYLSAAFNCAQRAPFDSSLPTNLIAFKIDHNPVDAIPAIPITAGNRTLTVDELGNYLNNLGNKIEDRALRLALLTGGQRIAQLLRTKVSDFDKATSVLRMWDGKGRRQSAREHLLPLGPTAASLVIELITRAELRQSKSLFATRNDKVLSFSTPGKRLAEIRTHMGCEHFDLKDIRRTVETMLAAMGITRDVRAQLLSHGISGVQATHYDRHLYIAEKRTTLIAWESKLTEITEGAKRQNPL
jgi:integrase